MEIGPDAAGCGPAHAAWLGVLAQFGPTLSTAVPGSGKGYLIVSDIVAARTALIAADVDIGEIFHIGPNGPVSGLDPERRTYRSWAAFKDPDGNSWVLQEITSRLPGRVDPGPTSFSSATDLATALRRAALAHGEHEKLSGKADSNWPDWYAEYLVREQAGEPIQS